MDKKMSIGIVAIVALVLVGGGLMLSNGSGDGLRGSFLPSVPRSPYANQATKPVSIKPAPWPLFIVKKVPSSNPMACSNSPSVTYSITNNTDSIQTLTKLGFGLSPTQDNSGLGLEMVKYHVTKGITFNNFSVALDGNTLAAKIDESYLNLPNAVGGVDATLNRGITLSPGTTRNITLSWSATATRIPASGEVAVSLLGLVYGESITFSSMLSADGYSPINPSPTETAVNICFPSDSKK